MKTAVITGASRGIGRATAEKFLKEGWSVIGTATRGEIDISNPNFKVVKLDYLDPKNITAAAETLKNFCKNIDVLVNNSGIAIEEEAEGVDIAALRKTLEVNLIGTADFTNRLIPLLHDGSHIINISSGAAGLTDYSKMNGWIVPSYKISKTALNMYTKVLADLLRDKGVTVSSLDPGWVKTEMGGKEAPRNPQEPAEEIYKLAVAKVETGQFWKEGKKRAW